ncbi:MAG: glycosyltransferase family 4 protein [Acidimicrobiaceae bacterium]|nr:glycosyltransferase family 4 protein [Acidimicrobiaceae bacterium]
MSDVSPSAIPGARVAIGYDCFFPLTVGGAERWYRSLAETLVERGATVTYLTRRQWDGPAPAIPGIKLVAVSRKDDLYDEKGVRKLLPGLRFGWGLFRYLLRNRSSFDVVQVGNFPYWSVIATRLALAGTKVPVVIDWHEIWSFRFWRSYVGPVIGTIGFLIQRLCLALTPLALVSLPTNARRIRAAGMRKEVVLLPGYLPSDMVEEDGGADAAVPADPPHVLFAARHIHDKGIDLLPGLAAELYARRPDVELVIAGGGPGTPELEATLAADAPGAQTRLVGFVEESELKRLMREATCVVIPSRREGYGLVLVEASRYGTPSAVAGFEENLCTDNVVAGVNGYVAKPPTAERLATVVLQILDDGMALRRSTLAWHRKTAPGSTMDHSVQTVIDLYEQLMVSRPRAAGRPEESPA